MYAVLRRLAPYLRPYRLLFAFSLLSMVLVDMVAYGVPLAIGYVTDTIYPRIPEDPSALRELWVVGGVLFLAALFRGVAIHFMIRGYWGVAERVVRDLRNSLYQKLQHLDMGFYDKSKTGDLMSRATYDIQLIRNFLAFGIEHRVRIILISVTVFFLMLFQQWQLALAVYTVIPIFVFAILHYSGRMREAVRRQQRQMGRLNSRLQESVTGIRVIKAFAVEEEEMARFNGENERMLQRVRARSPIPPPRKRNLIAPR